MSTSEILQDTELASLLLDGKKLDMNVVEATTDATLNRTITGASTIDLTLHDPDKAILLSGIFDTAVDMTIDQFKFELVKYEKQGWTLTATFEDWAVAQLRKITKPMKANRAKMTRAEFAKSIVDKVEGVTFFCPELKKKQPIAKKEDLPSQSDADNDKENGFAKNAGLTVKGQAATTEQLKNLNIVLKTGKSMGASDFLLQVSIAVVIDESSAVNLQGGDGTSVGLFQQVSKGWGTAAQRHDPAYAANSFFASGLQKVDLYPNDDAALLATAIQNPQVHSQGKNSTYYKAVNRWVPEAINIFNSWAGTDVPGGAPTTTGTKVYEFHLGGAGHLNETGWDCLQRLATEVDWRCYSIGSRIYFLPDRDLYVARPLDTLAEEDDTVDTIDFDLDIGKKVDHATVTCHASRWSVPPGAVVLLENVGRANGRWLVESISRSLFNDVMTITLIKPQPVKAEPRATESSGTSGSTALKHAGDFGGDIVINLAKQWLGLTYKGAPAYHMGGGHQYTFDQLKSGAVTPPFDCSGLTRYAWAKGGHVDIGGTALDQINHAKSQKWEQGTGPPPAGGWLEGDLLFPHTTHVNMSCGDGTMIGAHDPAIGITISPQYTTVYYWARPEPNA